MQSLNERIASRIEQRRAELIGQLPGYDNGGAKSIPCGLRRLKRDTRRYGISDRAAIDGYPDAAEDRDAAPARSGGADPTIRSIVKVNNGARPSAQATDPATKNASPVAASS